MGFPQEKAVQVWCDSKAAISTVKNPGNHKATKHIEIDSHYRWQDEIQKSQQEERELNLESSQATSTVGDSDSSYNPSSEAPSQEEQQAIRQGLRVSARPGKQTKRPHTLTPMEAERIRGQLKTKREHQKVAMTAEPMDIVSTTGEKLSPQETTDAWANHWGKLAQIWPTAATAAFPLLTSTVEEWTARTHGSNSNVPNVFFSRRSTKFARRTSHGSLDGAVAT